MWWERLLDPAVITALTGMLGVILVQSVQARSKAKDTYVKTKKLLNEIKETTELNGQQVGNHHSTNLRDDLTEVLNNTRKLDARLTKLGEELRAGDAEGRKRAERIELHSHETHKEIFERLNRLEGKEE